MRWQTIKSLAIGLPGVVIGVWVLRVVARLGQQLSVEALLPVAARSGLLAVGWVLGWNLVNLDVWVTKRLKIGGSWGGVMENWQRGVRNVLTLGVLAVVGIWLISSSQSILGWGTVLALQVRLWLDLVTDPNYENWYTSVTRKVGNREHQGVILATGGLLALQIVMLLNSA